jgi:hypothetical protein
MLRRYHLREKTMSEDVNIHQNSANNSPKVVCIIMVYHAGNKIHPEGTKNETWENMNSR